MQVTQTIFNEYDIRGLVGKELNSETAYKLGKLFSPETIIVGKDNRPSSKELVDGFIKGLMDSGCEVLELEGISSSPLLYFAHLYLKTKGAVMITGSHNPLEYNGFKFMLDAKPFYGENLKNIINNPMIEGTGSHRLVNLDNEYKEALLKNVKMDNSFKIAWECNNSAIGRFLKIPGEHFVLNSKLDGNFVHLPPDPCIEKNLYQIKEIIADKSCNFGFAFDGDGDRLVFIKGDGEVLSGDQLIYLLALSLKNEKNKKILIDVKASQILINSLEEQGFEVILAPSGHSLMKTRIIEENAIFAGELTGHFVFNDSRFWIIDDALYAAFRLIEYLQDNPIIELPLAQIRKEFKLPKNPNLDPQIYSPKGLRKDYDGGFFLIRASNTEDYILVKYEAMNEKIANIIRLDLENSLKEIDS
ncbi:MAG: hypothetical protein N4A31_00800 [Rickettsiales bacterium]|nr:hypothetical protein [Rickettsiales bacterium]